MFTYDRDVSYECGDKDDISDGENRPDAYYAAAASDSI